MEVIVAPEPMDYEIRGMYRFASLREDSGLAEAVRGRWPENSRLLMIAAEPENDTYTENLAMDLATDAQREAFFGELDMSTLLEGVKMGALVIALSEAARDAIR